MLAAETIMPLPRLNGTLTPKGAPRYDELFAEQLVTIMLAVGFDETGANRPVDTRLAAGLIERGFKLDPGAALARLADGKRPAPQRPATHLLARGLARDGAAIRSTSSSPSCARATAALAATRPRPSSRARTAARSPPTAATAATGPAPTSTTTSPPTCSTSSGQVSSSFSDYRDLEDILRERGRSHGRTALAEYRLLVKQRRLVIRRVNSGNLAINLRNYHPGEFGAHLMVDQLKADSGVRRMSKQRFDKKYRLWLFNGCRTHDYLYNLRKLNPQANAGGLDLVATRRLIYWSAISQTMLALVDGVCARDDLCPAPRPPGRGQPQTDDSDGETGPSHVAELSRRP
jgi:hypothetical protein